MKSIKQLMAKMLHKESYDKGFAEGKTHYLGGPEGYPQGLTAGYRAAKRKERVYFPKEI
jgi:hypothetical protein